MNVPEDSPGGRPAELVALGLDHTTAGIELRERLAFAAADIPGALGHLTHPAEAALVGLAEWLFRRRSELDDRDPSQRYFVNEELDRLAGSSKEPDEPKK